MKCPHWRILDYRQKKVIKLTPSVRVGPALARVLSSRRVDHLDLPIESTRDQHLILFSDDDGLDIGQPLD